MCIRDSGATEELYSTDTPAARALEKKALEFDLHLLQAKVKHLGTEKNLVILQNIYEDLKQGIEFRFHTAVQAIHTADQGYRLTLSCLLYTSKSSLSSRPFTR